MSIQPPQGPPQGPPQTPPQTPPPASRPPGPPPPPSANFRSGKQKTIALIVAGVVGAGLIGGVVGLALGGGSDDKPSADSGGNGSGILDPTPVGNISAAPTPEPVDPGATETTAPETTSPEPTEGPAPIDQPATGGDTVTIGGVQVYLPEGWKVVGDVGSDDVSIADSDGSWVYAVTGTVDPTSDAASVLNANLETFLPGDYYSQLQTGDIAPIDPFGSVVSGALLDYQGLWVDTQGSTPVYGRIYAAIRQDGTALLVGVEHSPPDDFEGSADSWGQVVDQTYNLFGSS